MRYKLIKFKKITTKIKLPVVVVDSKLIDLKTNTLHIRRGNEHLHKPTCKIHGGKQALKLGD